MVRLARLLRISAFTLLLRHATIITLRYFVKRGARLSDAAFARVFAAVDATRVERRARLSLSAFAGRDTAVGAGLGNRAWSKDMAVAGRAAAFGAVASGGPGEGKSERSFPCLASPLSAFAGGGVAYAAA